MRTYGQYCPIARAAEILAERWTPLMDWNQQAVRSAKDYLSMTHFSRAGLIEQLSSPYGSGYTVAQATYAANNVGL